ncbi:MAG TPA: prenyltransferase/squalene oxidase repeat-containing protein [Pirellulaceae bacterium]|jgi:hypothetical protein
MSLTQQDDRSIASHYFDDEAWPVQAAVAALGALLIGLVAQQQTSELAQWPLHVWIVVGSIGLATIGAMAGVAFVDPRLVRRPLQLALVLCLIVHAVLVVQMVHARMETGANLNLVPSRMNNARREPKKIAEYRPVEHLPEENRPRQDFEMPVESETPLPTEEREATKRQRLDNVVLDAPAESSRELESELKPQTAELDHKSREDRPEMPVLEAADVARSLVEAPSQTAGQIELPEAAAEAPAQAAAIQAAVVQASQIAVDQRPVAMPEMARRTVAEEPAQRSEPIVDQPTDARRRIPIYQQPEASGEENLRSEIAARGPARLAEPSAVATVELPALAQAAVEQARLDHQPLVAGTGRMQTERKPIASRDGSPGTTTQPATIARDQAPRLTAPPSSRRTERVDGSALIPNELAALARPSRSIAAPAAVRSVVPKEAFSARSARLRGGNQIESGGSVLESEDAIERGLVFLARHQRADGSWSLQGFPEGASLVSDTAATALAVMSFQGAGYNHRELAYHDVVARGLAFLLSRQKANGDLFVPLDDASNKSVWLYSHALAAIAVCEAYGMTQDASLREPAQRTIDFIVAAQQTERGGWRYAPGVGADTSVSGWMTMALKSGEFAGLAVPPDAYGKISHWLDTAQQSGSAPYLFCYNPYAPNSLEQRHGRVASKTMTAVGLLMRLYTGWRRDDANVTRGAAFLGTNLPSEMNGRQNERDTYYWYYATQVMAQVGGEKWQAWNDRLQPLLVKSQVRRGELAGSWDPLLPIADRWGPQAGRLYVTAMNLLSLEVEWRKLPVGGE